MKIIDFYIIRKFLSTFFLSISLIIVIVIIFDISENIDDFVDKQAPLFDIIFVYYLNFIPYFINLFSPLFTFIAVIFFTAKMASNTEIVAILGSGVSFRRMLVPYIISALFLTLISFYLSNFLIPYTNRNMINFKNTYIKNKFTNGDQNIHMQINPGVFAYVESYNVDNNEGRNFTLEKFDKGKMVYKLSSNSIIWDSAGRKWTLIVYNARWINGMHEKLVSGSKKDTVINMFPSDFLRKTDNIEIMNFSQLREFIDEEKMKGSENIKFYEVEKHKRIAFPLASLVLTLIAVSVSSRKVRGGIGIHIAFGLSITFTYVLFMKITETFATFGNLPPILAIWIPNIVYLMLGFYLLYKAPK